MLQEIGIVKPDPPPGGPAGVKKWIAAYASYLQKDRGLSQRTIDTYLWTVRPFKVDNYTSTHLLTGWHIVGLRAVRRSPGQAHPGGPGGDAVHIRQGYTMRVEGKVIVEARANVRRSKLCQHHQEGIY
jgi:hypothetical protein